MPATRTREPALHLRPHPPRAAPDHARGEEAPRASVIVQREWNGWQTAVVRLGDLRDVHWFRPRGALRPLIHGYVDCPDVQSGTLDHCCDTATRPHRLLVCVLKRHAAPGVYELLSARADCARPAGVSGAGVAKAAARARTRVVLALAAAGLFTVAATVALKRVLRSQPDGRVETPAVW